MRTLPQTGWLRQRPAAADDLEAEARATDAVFGDGVRAVSGRAAEPADGSSMMRRFSCDGPHPLRDARLRPAADKKKRQGIVAIACRLRRLAPPKNY